MSKTLVMSGFVALGLALAGCGSGGGAGGASGAVPVVNPPVGAPPATGAGTAAGDAKQVALKGGPAFVDSKTGLALYTFGGDTVPDQSTCTGGCLQIWPAHAATANDKASSGFTIFKRSDNGTLQWAYLGKPLYTFTSDTLSNNGSGDGVENFHIARPQASPTSSPTAQPTSPPSPPDTSFVCLPIALLRERRLQEHKMNQRRKGFVLFYKHVGVRGRFNNTSYDARVRYVNCMTTTDFARGRAGAFGHEALRGNRNHSVIGNV